MPQHTVTTPRNLFSKLSLALSSLCLIHCLAMPFVILLLPALAHFFGDTLELILILSVLPISLFAFIPTWNKHKNMRLLGIFTAGVTMILLSQFAIEHYHHTPAGHDLLHGDALSALIGRTTLMLVGVSMLAYSIYKNNKHTHVCNNPHHLH